MLGLVCRKPVAEVVKVRTRFDAIRRTLGIGEATTDAGANLTDERFHVDRRRSPQPA